VRDGGYRPGPPLSPVAADPAVRSAGEDDGDRLVGQSASCWASASRSVASMLRPHRILSAIQSVSYRHR
jgi:hypothetical protein